MSREAWCFCLILSGGLFVGSCLGEITGIWPIPLGSAALMLASFVAIDRIDDKAFRDRMNRR